MPVQTQVDGGYQIKSLSIPESKLSAAVQAKLNAVAGGDIITTADEAILAGSLVYISSSDGVSKGDATVSSKVGIIGVTLATVVNIGDPVTVRARGSNVVRLVGLLTLTAGDRIFLLTDGRGTNVPPSSPCYHVEIGVVIDPSGYDPLGANPTAVVATCIRDPIEIF